MTPDKKPQKFKRTQYLISTKFQLKYVSQILLLMFLTAVLCSFVVYYTGMIVLGEKLASVYPQGRLMAILTMVNIRVFFSVILVSPLVAIIAILLSHRIAGPIYRIESFLTSMASGNLAYRLTLRQGDEFMNIADKINLLIDSLKSTIGDQRANLEKVIGELEGLKKVVESRPSDVSVINSNINRLEKELAELEKKLDWYKV